MQLRLYTTYVTRIQVNAILISLSSLHEDMRLNYLFRIPFKVLILYSESIILQIKNSRNTVNSNEIGL